MGTFIACYCENNFRLEVMTRILHIGMGKTGSTTLQRKFFPKLCRDLDMSYNPIELVNLLVKYSKSPVSEEIINELRKKILSYENLFLSSEAFVGWNPHNWNKNCQYLRNLFPENTYIILVIRDPKDYFRSVYLQQLQQGNILPPHNFFVTSETYNYFKYHLSQNGLQMFDVDKFNYCNLVRLYQDAFSKIFVVNFNEVFRLEFMRTILEKENFDTNIIDDFDIGKKIYNRSYSKTSVFLTIYREKLLNFFNFKTISSHDLVHELNRNVKNHSDFPFSRFFRWRWVMHGFVDRIIPYKEYKLPKDLYLNNDLIQLNRKYLFDLKAGDESTKN